MAAVPPTPKQDVMQAVIAIDAAREMAAGSGRGMKIEPEIALHIDPAIDPDIDLARARRECHVDAQSGYGSDCMGRAADGTRALRNPMH